MIKTPIRSRSSGRLSHKMTHNNPPQNNNLPQINLLPLNSLLHNKGSLLPKITKRGMIPRRRISKIVPIVRRMVMMNMSARINRLMNWST